MINRLFNYFKETKGELKHVTWPSKKQTIDFTIVVIVFSLGVALFLGLFDKIFSSLLEIFIF